MIHYKLISPAAPYPHDPPLPEWIAWDGYNPDQIYKAHTLEEAIGKVILRSPSFTSLVREYLNPVPQDIRGEW
jgi:hypothetical protein